MNAPARPGVILDRDGTLIDFVRDAELGAVVSAFHPDHIRLLPGVAQGLALLQDAGFVLAIATNQPGAAKGQIPESAITRTNQALVDALAREGIRIEAVRTCLHHPEGGPGGDPALATDCGCRKPKPGMLLSLVDELGLDPARSWMVGDAAVDVLAARGAGLRAGLLFEWGRCEMCPVRGGFDEIPMIRPDASASRFDELARRLRDSLAMAPG
ncbi:D-glycero-alpha-D-manno-heptose-1,7-bisphosphate 7-phosphatase [Polyangium fumosum]|uniref:D,D-heptose 1,7-bisphosphate phosphatase n=1 Tax=Polyangium fumosum TaxID=889272 RepID=A0A4U1IX25_9BACT|nr:HAD-IIIA family hydrolase [Polyangium fumosum]